MSVVTAVVGAFDVVSFVATVHRRLFFSYVTVSLSTNEVCKDSSPSDPSIVLLLTHKVSIADDVSNSLLDEDTTSVCSFGSRADLHRLSETPVPSWVHVGEPVHVSVSHGGTPRTGHIQFVGLTEFASGVWVGIELDTADGKQY